MIASAGRHAPRRVFTAPGLAALAMITSTQWRASARTMFAVSDRKGFYAGSGAWRRRK
jgi:hypothetical protein